jgi:hypothetical protein
VRARERRLLVGRALHVDGSLREVKVGQESLKPKVQAAGFSLQSSSGVAKALPSSVVPNARQATDPALDDG